MKIRGFLLTLVLMFWSGCQKPVPDFHPNQPSFSVITYNVNWGFVKPQNVVLFLEDQSADVICLQETHRQWEDFLKVNLKNKYPYSVFKEWGGAGGLGILSKYEIDDAKLFEPVEGGFFPALFAQIQTPLGKVQFLNLHLRPAVSDRGSVTLYAIYDNPNIHLDEIRHFLSKINSGQPLIIAGDFNEDDGGKAVRFLVDNGFKDSLNIFDSSTKTWGTELSLGIKLKERLDHIMFNAYFKCSGARVMQVEASDHMPIEAVYIENRI